MSVRIFHKVLAQTNQRENSTSLPEFRHLEKETSEEISSAQFPPRQTSHCASMTLNLHEKFSRSQQYANSGDGVCIFLAAHHTVRNKTQIRNRITS